MVKFIFREGKTAIWVRAPPFEVRPAGVVRPVCFWVLNFRAMNDVIEIKDLLLRTVIGVNPEERVNRQDVWITIRLWADTRPAAGSDRIEDAVNYRTVCKEVIDFVEASQFQLVETLAAEIARLCLRERRLERVQVSVHKPGALRFARSVGVVLERTREDFNGKRFP